MTGLSEKGLRKFTHTRWISLRSTHPTSTLRKSQSECRPVARALEGGGGAVDRLLAVVAAHQHEPDGSAVLHPAWYADRRMPGDIERARFAGRLPASLRDLLRRCVLAGNWRRLHRYRRQQQKVVRRKNSIVTCTHAPAQVLRLGVEVTAIAVECVLAEDRGDLQRIGEFVSTLAPAHRVVEQAGDVKPLMPNSGAVHFQEHDAARCRCREQDRTLASIR